MRVKSIVHRLRHLTRSALLEVYTAVSPHNANIEMSVHSSLRATTSLASQTKSLSNQFRKSCSVKASTTTGHIDATTTALHGKSGRKCMLTGKRANNGYTVSFSHIRNKKMQRANLQVRLSAWFWSRCWWRRASFGRQIRFFCLRLIL